jgi:hypothetical protein
LLGIPRRKAQRVLASGLAGTPLRRPGAHLHDARTIAALVERPELAADGVQAHARHGLFVARRDVDVRQPPADLRPGSALAGDWDSSPGSGCATR